MAAGFTSLILSSYINAVSGAITEQMTDTLGLEYQALVVEHNGVKVGYQYQMWKIKDASVCNDNNDNILMFSQCTQAAKSLFEEACQYLQANPQDHWKHRKLKNMYCAAAVSFKPTVAALKASTASGEASLYGAKQECSMLTVAALGSSDSTAVSKRDKACEKYRLLKQGGDRQ